MSFFSKITKPFKKLFSGTVGKVLQLATLVGAIVAFASPGWNWLGYLLLGASSAIGYFGGIQTPSLDFGIKDNGHLLNTQGKIDEPIPLIYGTCRTGGNLVFIKTSGTDNKYLYQAMVIGEGNLGNIMDIQLDDTSLFPIEITDKKSNNQWIVILKNDITNVKGSIKITFSYSYTTGYKTYWKFDENGNYIQITEPVTKTVTATKDLSYDVSKGNTQNITYTYTYYTDEYWGTSQTNTIDIATVSLQENDIGELELIINANTTYNSIIEEVRVDSYSEDNGTTWYNIDKKKMDKIDAIYFDGLNLYKLDKTASTSTWTSIDYTDSLFQEFVDNGFMVETYDGTDKYFKAMQMLWSRKVALLLTKLTYDRDVWKNVPNITVTIQGRKGTTPFIQDDTLEITLPFFAGITFTVDIKTEHIFHNPVEVLFDYLTNSTYGMNIPVEKLDIELDENGKAIGGSWKNAFDYAEMKGFVFDGIIKSGRTDEIISMILNHFRGELIYHLGKFKLLFRDMPVEIESGLVYPDVIELEEGNDSFKITYPDITDMYDQVEVTFINPSINYKTDKLLIPETVELGRNPNKMNLSLHGCNYTQAKLLGTYFLERSRLGTVISFVTSHKYIDLQVGQLFRFTNEQWGIKEQWFRCTSIKPNIDGTIQIDAIIEDENLYNDTYEPNIYDIDITEMPSPTDIPPKVKNVTLSEETVYDKDGTPMSYLNISWTQVATWIDTYEIWISEDNVNWRLLSVTNGTHYKALLQAYKTYYIKVIPVSIWGVKGNWDDADTYSVYIYGITDAPTFIGGLSVKIDNIKKLLVAQWSKVYDKDFDHYVVTIYEKDTNNILNTFFTSTNKISIPLEYESDIIIGVKAVNTSGVESTEYTKTLIKDSTYESITGHINCAGNVLILNTYNILNYLGIETLSGDLTKIKGNIITTRDLHVKTLESFTGGNVTTDIKTGLGWKLENVVIVTKSNLCSIYQFNLFGNKIKIEDIYLPDNVLTLSYMSGAKRVVSWLDVHGGNIYLAYLIDEDGDGVYETLNIDKNGAFWKSFNVGDAWDCRFFMINDDDYMVAYLPADEYYWRIYSSVTGTWANSYLIASTGNVFPQKLNDGIFYKTDDTSLPTTEQYRKIDLNLNDTYIADANHFRAYNPYERSWYIGYSTDYLYRITEDGTQESNWYYEWKIL